MDSKLEEPASFDSMIQNPMIRLLRDMESQVDTTAGKLQLGMRRMNDFIKANSGMCSRPMGRMENQTDGHECRH